MYTVHHVRADKMYSLKLYSKSNSPDNNNDYKVYKYTFQSQSEST